MEQTNIKKQAKKAAKIIGIATFLGYSFIAFVPELYRNPFAPFPALFFLVFSPLGIIEAFILGWITYLIFKSIKNRLLYRFSLVLGILICMVLGIALQVFIWRQSTKSGPFMNKIDTNRDGKIDKWIYDDDNLNTIVEIDTNYDSQPDTKEYYKNGKFIKKEIRLGSEWKDEQAQ